MLQRPLTDKQEAVLHYVEEYVNRERDFPSIRTIQDEFGYKSPNTAAFHVRALVKKGYLVRREGGNYDLAPEQYYLTSREKEELTKLFMGMLDLWERGATLTPEVAQEYREAFREIING